MLYAHDVSTATNSRPQKLLIEDDDSTPDGYNAKNHSELGTIRVELVAITIGSLLPPGSGVLAEVALPGDTPISEKAKKAGSHAAQ